MRALLQFALFLAAVFFIVGEFLGGWYLGVPPQTPIFLYKKTHTAVVERQTRIASEFPFSVSGSLRQGSVTVEASYERPSSFQDPGRRVLANRVYFSEIFGAGQPIAVSEVLERGEGVYRLVLTFTDASGTLRLDVPPRNAF